MGYEKKNLTFFIPSLFFHPSFYPQQDITTSSPIILKRQGNLHLIMGRHLGSHDVTMCHVTAALLSQCLKLSQTRYQAAHEFHETGHSVTFYFMKKKKTKNDALTSPRQSQFSPKMKANAVPRLLSSLV